MAKRVDLTREQQVFVVQLLACFKTPSEVAALVKEEFGVNIERQNVRHYNPLQSPDVAGEWKDLFERTREEFLKQTTQIAVYNQTYRLAELQDLYHLAKSAGNIILAAALLEQIAKECGGQFTNKQQQDVSFKGQMVSMSVEEWQKQRDERRRQAEETAGRFEGPPGA